MSGLHTSGYQQCWKILNMAVGDKGYIYTEHIL